MPFRCSTGSESAGCITDMVHSKRLTCSICPDHLATRCSDTPFQPLGMLPHACVIIVPSFSGSVNADTSSSGDFGASCDESMTSLTSLTGGGFVTSEMGCASVATVEPNEGEFARSDEFKSRRR